MTAALMPAAFLGHGSLVNALEDNRFTAAELPDPQVVPLSETNA